MIVRRTLFLHPSPICMISIMHLNILLWLVLQPDEFHGQAHEYEYLHQIHHSLSGNNHCFRFTSGRSISGFRSFKHSKFSSEVTVNGKLGVPPIPLALLFNTYTRDRRTATRSSFSQSRTLIPGRFEYSGRLEIFSNAPITPKYFFCLFNSNRISDLSANIIKTFVQARWIALSDTLVWTHHYVTQI